MDKQPFVSVVIPAYNAEAYIDGCLESVLFQNYTYFEVIVVDDGSTDATFRILKDKQKEDSRLKIYSIVNSGPSRARNYGIEQAKGEYIILLDADDKLLADSISKRIEMAVTYPDIDMLGCGFVIGNDSNSKCVDDKVMRISKYRLLFKNDFRPSTIILKREILETHRFNIKQKFSEDYLLWLQIAFDNRRMALMKAPLVALYDKPLWGAAGLSAHLWRLEKYELGNFCHLLSMRKISFPLYMIASVFSMMKHTRRVMITALRNCLVFKNMRKRAKLPLLKC